MVAEVEIKPRGEIDTELVGGVFDMIVRRLPGGNGTLRVIEAHPNEMLRHEYIDGPVSGVGTFTLTPVDGKTRLSYHWHIRPSTRLMRLLIRVMPWTHRRYMWTFFAGLRRHLEDNRPGPAAA